MQIADILRKAADLVDAAEGSIAQEPEAQQVQDPAANAPGQLAAVEVDTDDNTDKETMVSPLQQEHELLKMSQGIDNNVAEFAGDSDMEESNGEMDQAEQLQHPDHSEDEYKQMFGSDKESDDDELAQMKKMAGIGEEQQGPVDHAEECKPVSLNPRANAALEANGKEHLKFTKRRDR